MAFIFIHVDLHFATGPSTAVNDHRVEGWEKMLGQTKFVALGCGRDRKW